MIRVDGNSLAGPLGQGTQLLSQDSVKTGRLNGEQVSVKDTASVLADAAEEISLHHAEKVESKTFEEREVADEKPIDVMKAEEIMAYLASANSSGSTEELVLLAKRMQSNQENPRELARQQNRDPSHQYVLIQYALADAMGKGAEPQVLERLQDALADLEMESGPQIRAGLNTITTASEFGGDAGGVANFQSTYRDVVLGDNALSQTLKLVLERLGGPSGTDFAKGLQGLIKAMGTDLSATRPSTDANRLQALVQDLYQLEVTATVLDNCNELSASLKSKFDSPGVNAFELMKDLVNVVGEKWVGPMRFTSLAESFQLQRVDAQIAFHTGIKAMLREIPVKVFPDHDLRQTILTAAQGALDVAIDKEEE